MHRLFRKIAFCSVNTTIATYFNTRTEKVLEKGARLDVCDFIIDNEKIIVNSVHICLLISSEGNLLIIKLLHVVVLSSVFFSCKPF